MTIINGNGTTRSPRQQRLQAVLDLSVRENHAPFMVGMLVDANGTRFSGAAGDATAGRPADLDTVFRIFSMSKAIGATAAMILIDRGLLSMDATVESVLPAFADVKVLNGYDASGKPMLRTPRIKATIRHLATHTSGLAYEFWCAEETAHLQAIGSGGVLAASKLQTTLLNDYPMITEPGTRWAYGVSIDWLGLVVEAVSGMKIMDFLRANLLDPLGMKDTDAIVRDDMKDRLASVNLRGVNGSFTAFPVDPPATSDTFGMGHALYSTARDYAKFLRMILNKGELDGQRVLSASAVAQLLADQTPTGLVFREAVTTSPLSANFNPHPEVPKSHAFAFLRFDADVHGARRAGSVGWAGVCNSHYWIDPSSGIAGLFMTQTLPFAEAPYMVAYEAFERAAYA